MRRLLLSVAVFVGLLVLATHPAGWRFAVLGLAAGAVLVVLDGSRGGSAPGRVLALAAVLIGSGLSVVVASGARVPAICLGCGSAARPGAFVTVPMQVDVRYSDNERSWTVAQRLWIPTDQIDRAAALVLGADQRLPGHDQEVALLAGRLSLGHWHLVGHINGEPIFTRTLVVPDNGGMLPLSSRERLSDVDVPLSSADGFLTPAAGSSIQITTPEGLLSSTEPPGEARPVPSGTRWLIPVGTGPPPAGAVEVQMVSPLARWWPLQPLVRASSTDQAGWLLAALWGLTMTVLGRGLKRRLRMSVVWVRARPRRGRQPTVGNGDAGAAIPLDVDGRTTGPASTATGWPSPP